MKNNTGFNMIGGNGLQRCVDQNNQIVYCANCKFTAPLSVSYEHFKWLHETYNHIVGGRNTCVYTIVVNNKDEDKKTSSRMIKLNDFDGTVNKK